MTRRGTYVWRRRAERVAPRLPVRWGADGSCIHRGLLTSLSTVGAFIEAQFASLACERVHLLVPDGAGHLHITGEVVYYVSGRGLAVEFAGLTPEGRERLAHLVERVPAAAGSDCEA